jgi:hypothetical protein
MSRISVLCSIVAMLCAAPAVAAPAKEGDSRLAQLEKSLQTWKGLEGQCGGNYSYKIRWSSMVGFGHETEIVVCGGKVAQRRYHEWQGRPRVVQPGAAPAKPDGTSWVEKGDQLGSHKKGAPVKTLDELYEQARKVLQTKLAAHHRLYVGFDKRGLLQSCFYVDTRIADDAPRTGVLISGITLGEAAESGKDGWTALFDGKTLKGWKGREGLWKVEDGAIFGQTTAKAKLKHNDFLYTEKEYGDFELKLKFRLINHNSGVQVRSQVHKDFRVTGYQADIAERRYTGILYGEGFGGILADVDQKKLGKHVKKGDWNDYRILCQGKRLQFWINGQPTIDYTDKRAIAATKGVIAFQLHGGPPMKVYFKDIVIKELAKGKD